MSTQRIKVVHKYVTDEKGFSKLENAKPLIQQVKAVYLNGMLRTGSGDVWNYEANPNKKESDFISVVPRKKAANN